VDELLTDKNYQLERFQAKGGWTFVIIDEIPPEHKGPFGMVRVKGRIDDYDMNSYRLMPLGDGRLFLPVKAEIRKRIRKKEGDWVRVTLFADNTPLDIPEELIDCLREEPVALQYFMRLTEGKQKEFRDWIYSAKKDETKVERIARTIDQLLKGRKLDK
jgi:hypothetical protein